MYWIVHGIYNNWLPNNKGNWLNDKPEFVLTCDTISGSLEGCPETNLSSDWRSEKLNFLALGKLAEVQSIWVGVSF